MMQIMIIGILIVGISCMYVVVENSTTIGKAITTFSKTSITLPNGFSVGETDSKSAQLYNKQNNEKLKKGVKLCFHLSAKKKFWIF